MRRCSWCSPSSAPPASGCCCSAEFLAIALVLVYVGAVMVLFLFVVMMLDINIDALREGFWKHFPLAALVGVADRARDGAGADAAASTCAQAPPPDAAALQARQHQAARHRDLHRLPVPAADRRGAAAGGHHRGDRADAAPAQGQPSTSDPVEQVRVKKADRVRIVPMTPDGRGAAAPRRRRAAGGKHDPGPRHARPLPVARRASCSRCR